MAANLYSVLLDVEFKALGVHERDDFVEELTKWIYKTLPPVTDIQIMGGPDLVGSIND